MDKNDPIEKRILKHLSLNQRASTDKLLVYVRRNGLPRTTLQEVTQRIDYLVRKDMVELHSSSRPKRRIYILSEDTREELEDEQWA